MDIGLMLPPLRPLMDYQPRVQSPRLAATARRWYPPDWPHGGDAVAADVHSNRSVQRFGPRPPCVSQLGSIGVEAAATSVSDSCGFAALDAPGLFAATQRSKRAAIADVMSYVASMSHTGGSHSPTWRSGCAPTSGRAFGATKATPGGSRVSASPRSKLAPRKTIVVGSGARAAVRGTDPMAGGLFSRDARIDRECQKRGIYEGQLVKSHSGTLRLPRR